VESLEWTAEREAELRRCVELGFSAATAAIKLGCSRNAAIGKAQRLHLNFNSDIRSTPKETKAEKMRDNSGRAGPRDLVEMFDSTVGSRRTESEFRHHVAVEMNLRQQRERQALPIARPRSTPRDPTPFDVLEIVPAITEEVAPPVTLFDLRNNQCRAPAGQSDDGALFCGAAVFRPGASWCPEHHKKYCVTAAQARR
jgi:hypothetical protein